MSGFEFDFLGYDPYVSAEDMADHDVTKVDFEELLERSDVVSIHTPLTDETEGLFDSEAFDRMDESAVVVNTSRGAVVEMDALYSAVQSGEIYAAGLDVLPSEPPSKDLVLDHDRIVYTPHMAWYSEASMRDLRETVTRDVLRVLDGKQPENPVNDLNG